MLTFKTQFPIDSTKSPDDLLECARAWIAGSPHSELARELTTTQLQDGTSLSTDNESLFALVYTDSGRETAGVRYEKRQDGEIRWVTDVVGSKSENEFVVAVQLSVDSELPVERLDQGKRPYILKSLMERVGGGVDGDLVVSDSPIMLKEQELSLAADIICARASYAMPIVYVSASNNDKPYIDIEQTAKWLSGMAHVVVEPSRSFSFKLMREVYGENAYGGAVGIYWPDGIGKWLFLPTGNYADPKDMQVAVARKIRSSLLSQRTKRECTWSHLQELISRRHLKELKDSGSSDINEYIRHFDAEVASKDEEIRRLEAELSRARYARQLTNDAPEVGESRLSLVSTENDLHQAERLDFIIDALKAAAEAAEVHGRRRDVLDDLIQQNNHSGERDQILDRLKPILRQYDSMTAPVRAELESLGFSILEDGKHYKLVYRNDTRYPFILSKTGSDWRGGLNAFSDLKRRIF